MFEGVPTYPDAGRFWKMIQDHKVTVFYTAPTAIRSLIKAGGDLPKSYGPPTTCYNRFVRWRRAGIWDRIMNGLATAQMRPRATVEAEEEPVVAV